MPLGEDQNWHKGQTQLHVSSSSMDRSTPATYASLGRPDARSKKKRRANLHTRARVDPIWVNGPDWVKKRVVNNEQTSSQSHLADIPPLPEGCPPSPAGPSLSSQINPLPQHVEVPPQPQLQPLLFTKWQSQPIDNSNKESVHATWWAHISNSLSSYSVRSYKLFLASTFVTCKTEELMLLYEVRKLNADGVAIFKEVLRGLRVRAANWEGNMDELRISWDIRSKLEMVKVHDEFVAEQVANLEMELRGGASECSVNDAQTVSDSHERQEMCDFEDSRSVGMGLMQIKENALPTADGLPFSWAHVTVEVLQVRYSQPLADAEPPSTVASLRTWAKVVASSVKNHNFDPGPRRRSVTRSSKKWGGLSGAAWE